MLFKAFDVGRGHGRNGTCGAAVGAASKARSSTPSRAEHRGLEAAPTVAWTKLGGAGVGGIDRGLEAAPTVA